MKIQETLARLGQGGVSEELEDCLRKAAIESIDKDGKSTVTLQLSLSPNGDSGVTIESVVKMSTPTTKHAKTFLYVNEGELSVKDPAQMQLGAPVGE